MNILHLDEQRTWRGGEQQATWLMNGLRCRGHHVIAAGRHAAPFLTRNAQAGVETVEFPFHGELDLYTARCIARLSHARSVDILHAHTSHTHSIACMARGLGAGAKVVVSRRVSFAPRPNRVNRWKYSLPDKFICVSNSVDKALQKFGIPENKRVVVHSAIDFDRIQQTCASKTDLGLSNENLLLFSAGALSPQKDFGTLLDAFAHTVFQFPNARLLIAGEGNERGTLEARMKAMNLEHSVRLLGHREDVPAITRAADVYVSSSWSEGLGTSILEALACETPVVATDAGGVNEMVLQKKTGLLVSSRDPRALAEAMAYSLTHRDEAKAMARDGAVHVRKHFTVQRMVEETIRIYEQVRAE